MYVVEIPAGGALEPERHLYDELIYVLRGRGLSEIWHQGQPKRTFEWGEGSLFAIPLNAWHRLVNGGQEPVLLFAQTSLPAVMNTLRNSEFIFNCDYNFTDRYTGLADYFLDQKAPSHKEETRFVRWETNFVADVRTCFLGDHLSPQKVLGGRQTGIRMAGWGTQHTSEWPVGMYHKAHYHGPGAILFGLRSSGFVLMWHAQYGLQPFQDGHADKVVNVNWKPGSIYCPPTDWFHQHFNTGPESARHWATTGGGIGIELPSLEISTSPRGGISAWRHDGRIQGFMEVIEHEDEDPEIRRMFKEELKKNGIEFAMPPLA